MCSSRLLRASLLLALCLFVSSAVLAQPAPFDALPDLWVADNTVRSLDVVGDTLYIGGDFEYVGRPTGQLAALDKETGEPDLSLPRFDAAGIGSFGLQVALPDGQGGYYVGGDFRFVSGQVRRNLAHVLADGTLDPDFRPDPVEVAFGDSSGYVNALYLTDGVLYVGGRFNRVGGEPRRDLAALDTATGAVLPLSADFALSNSPFPPVVEALAVVEGTLYVGGLFTSVNGQPRVGAAALDAETGAVLPWRADLARKNPNFSAAASEFGRGDSTLYLSGAFEFVDGQPRGELAEVTLADPVTGEGGEVTPWAPSVGALDFIVTDEYVWGAGNYTGGPLARIDRETGAVVTFQVDAELSMARAIAFDPVGGLSDEGTFYLACRRLFDGFDSFPVVVGVDPASGQATGYEVLAAPGDSSTDFVGTVAVEPGPEGRVFAGGSTVSVGGVRRSFLAALDLTTGRALPPFTGEVLGSVLDLAASPDGRTVYFGAFFGLGVLDVETWTLRNFGRANATRAAWSPTQAAPADAGVARPVLERSPAPPIPETSPPATPPAAYAASGSPRVLGNNSAFAVTERALYFCGAGCVAFDRQTEEEVWLTLGAGIIGRDTNVLLLDGPGGPGGDRGTLYLSGGLEELPLGQTRVAFGALDPRTGDVFDWDVGVTLAGPGGSLGGGIAWLDRDGDGPEEAALYLGGDQLFEVQGAMRGTDLLAVDPETAALLPWDPAPFLGERRGASTLAAQPTEDGGVVYTNNGLALDAETAELLDWDPDVIGGTVLLSERHEALFFGGFFSNSLKGSGHAGVVAVELAAAFPPPPVSSEDEAVLPAIAALSAAHPNPFRSTATVTLAVPHAGPVEVALFDVLGRRVMVLHDGPLAAGSHALTVDGAGLPSGVYVVRASGAGFTASRRVTVVR